jgi:hypothetical protein
VIIRGTVCAEIFIYFFFIQILIIKLGQSSTIQKSPYKSCKNTKKSAQFNQVDLVTNECKQYVPNTSINPLSIIQQKIFHSNERKNENLKRLLFLKEVANTERENISKSVLYFEFLKGCLQQEKDDPICPSLIKDLKNTISTNLPLLQNELALAASSKKRNSTKFEPLIQN